MHEDLTITLGVEDELHRVSEIIRDGSSTDRQVDHFRIRCLRVPPKWRHCTPSSIC